MEAVLKQQDETPTPPAHLRSHLAFSRWPLWKYLLAYTLLFVAFFCACYWIFLAQGKSFIWMYDTLEQQFTNLIYEGGWLRGIAGATAENGQLTVPLWDLSFGYGADIPTFLAQILGDPLNLTSAFVPPERAETLFHVLVVVRFYLAGLAFSAYARWRGNSSYACLAGALLYTFGGWMSVSFYQSPFAYPMVLFPLLLWGADRIMEGKGPALFIISVALFYGTYFYFAYMASLVLVPYCVVEFCRRRGGFAFGAFVRCVASFLFFYFVGVAISSLLFLPEAYSLLQEGRLGLDRPLDLLYLPSHYTDLLRNFIGIGTISPDANFGFGAMGLTCVVMLFASRGRAVEKGYFIALTICLLLPLLGRIFNGFSYASDRWAWAYTFFVCYLFCLEVPNLLEPEGRSLVAFGCVAAVVALYLLMVVTGDKATIGNCAALFALLGLLVLFRFVGSASAKGVAFLVFMALDLGFCNLAYYHGRIDQQVDAGVSWETIYERSPLLAVDAIEDPGLWRYDLHAVPRTRNASILHDLNSSDLYNSFYNDRVDRLNTLLGVPTAFFNNQMGELDGRAYLESLMAMKYLLISEGTGTDLAPGYGETPVSSMEMDGATYAAYEYDYALPLAFGFGAKEVMGEEDLEAISLTERPEALLESLVLEDVGEGSAKNLDLSASQVPYTLSAGAGVEFDGERFTVTEPNAAVTLEFEAPGGAETNLAFRGLNYEASAPVRDESQGVAGLLRWTREMLDWHPATEAIITITDPDGPAMTIRSINNENHLYAGKHDWVVNLGYDDEARTQATLTFSTPGTYSLEGFEVVSQPLDELPGVVGQREAFHTTITESVNAYDIESEVPQGEEGYVFCTIPYSTGWSATLDGEAVEPLLADVAFMAFPVGPGTHHIHLDYATPLLSVGAVTSLVGLALLVALTVLVHTNHLGVRRWGAVGR